MTVRREWNSLEAVLARNGIALSFLPGATPDEIADAEATTGRVWPSDLVEFYSVHNGQDVGKGLLFGELLPMSEFYPLPYLAEEYGRLVEDGKAELQNDSVLRESVAGSEAGTPSNVFLPEYFPMCGLDSYYYFVDARQGVQSGCIRRWTKDDGDNSQVPIWSSLSEMLAAVRTAVESGTELIDGWRPSVTDDNESRELTWILTG